MRALIVDVCAPASTRASISVTSSSIAALATGTTAGSGGGSADAGHPLTTPAVAGSTAIGTAARGVRDRDQDKEKGEGGAGGKGGEVAVAGRMLRMSTASALKALTTDTGPGQGHGPMNSARGTGIRKAVPPTGSVRASFRG